MLLSSTPVHPSVAIDDERAARRCADPRAECGPSDEAWWQHRVFPGDVSEVSSRSSTLGSGCRASSETIDINRWDGTRPAWIVAVPLPGWNRSQAKRSGRASWFVVGISSPTVGRTGPCSTNSHVICPEDNLNRRAITPSARGSTSRRWVRRPRSSRWGSWSGVRPLTCSTPPSSRSRATVENFKPAARWSPRRGPTAAMIHNGSSSSAIRRGRGAFALSLG